jgi:hypothetical protein
MEHLEQWEKYDLEKETTTLTDKNAAFVHERSGDFSYVLNLHNLFRREISIYFT